MRHVKHWKMNLPLVLPFAVWMALMFALPPSAASYAIRSAATAAAGIACIVFARRTKTSAVQEHFACGSAASVSVGILAGLAVFGLWIALPCWPMSEPVVPSPSPYDPAVCGWALALAKLAGSAFVIAPAEEYFFRSFLYRWLIARDISKVPLSKFDGQAFLWTVLLFTLEHDRPLAAAITAAIYGILAIKLGMKSAVAAHVTTNLVLGIYVIFGKAWQYW